MKYYHILLAAALMLVAGCQEKSSPETPVTPPEPVEVANGFFVTPDGRGDKTGEDWDNAWSYDQFHSNLYSKSDAERANADVEKYNGKTFYLSGGDYKTKDQIILSYYYSDVEEPVSITFKGGYSPLSTGKDLSKRDLTKYPTNIIAGNNRQILAGTSKLDLTCDGIVFDCEAGNTTDRLVLFNPISNSTVVATFKDCEFHNLASTRSGSALYNNSAFVKLDNVLFSGNESVGEGAALYNTGTVFMNNCRAIYNNITSETGYGNAINSTATKTSIGQLCMYNTFVGKNTGAGRAVEVRGDKGTALIANSTIIDEESGALRYIGADSTSVIVNSVILSESTRWTAIHLYPATRMMTLKGHNLVGPISENGAVGPATQCIATDTDVTDCTISGLGMTWVGETFLWNGVFEGFTRATLDEVKAAMAEYKPTQDETLGQQFVDWLESIDAFETDCYGNTRPADSFWPGAYQGAN